MNLKSYLGAAGIVAMIAGVPFVFFPAWSIALYGLTTDPAGLLISRFFGASFFSFGVLLWYVREAIDPDEHRHILVPLAICSMVGFVISFTGQLSGLLNALGWSIVAIFGIVAVGFWWYSRR